jgi:hypothetical protein
MRTLDQPLRLKHALIVAAAALTLGAGATAIAGSGGDNGKSVARGGASTTSAGDMVYRTKTKTNRAGQQTSIRVKCPSGTRVQGGGGGGLSTIAGDQALNFSVPFDGGDSGAAPDDGWVAYVDNNTGRNLEMVGWAVCEDA